MRKIYIYIIKEFIPNYILGFLFFSIFLIIQLLFQIIGLYIEKNAPLGDVLTLLFYGIVWVVSFSIPFSVLIGTVLSLGRISSDSEVTALRANGIGLINIFKPIIFMGIIIMLLNILYYEITYPWGMYKYYNKLTNLGMKDPTTQLTENYQYKDPRSKCVIQVDSVDNKTRELIEVKITSKKDNKLIIAEKGKFLEYDEENEVYPLILYNTLTHPLDSEKDNNTEGTFYEMHSKEMIINLSFAVSLFDFKGNASSWSISQIFKGMEKKEIEYSIKIINMANSQADRISKISKMGADINYDEKDINNMELAFIKNDIDPKTKESINSYFDKIKKENITITESKETSSENIPSSYLFEYHKKFSYSISCLIFALIGAPLSIFSARSGKSYGLGISLLFISIWYGAYFVCERLLHSINPINLFGVITLYINNPVFRAWLPPLILIPAAIFLWYNKLKT